MTSILEDIFAESSRLLEEVARQRLTVRVLGGLAVRIHTDGVVPASLTRTYRDIDLVTPSGQGTPLSRFLVEMGYEPNERFNTWNETRLIFDDVPNERQVDVFVGDFRMCHRISLTERNELESQTVPLAELLLTKLQVVRLTDKDLVDIYALFYAHEVGEVDEETINAGQVARLCAADWGLWRTTTKTLEEAREHLAQSALATSERTRIEERIDHLRDRIEAESKSLRWKARDRIGERARWYEEPEEIE